MCRPRSGPTISPVRLVNAMQMICRAQTSHSGCILQAHQSESMLPDADGWYEVIAGSVDPDVTCSVLRIYSSGPAEAETFSVLFNLQIQPF